jgi:hypothetical protein
MRWRNGLMGLSVMAITPVSHEVSEPHDLETGRAILFIPTSNPTRALPLGRLPRKRVSPWVGSGRRQDAFVSCVVAGLAPRSLQPLISLEGAA